MKTSVWVIFVCVFFLSGFLEGFKGQVRWPKGPPHLTLNPPCFLGFVFVVFVFFGGVKGQVRWPKKPPHLALDPPLFFGFFCFLFFLFFVFRRKNLFPHQKGVFLCICQCFPLFFSCFLSHPLFDFLYFSYFIYLVFLVFFFFYFVSLFFFFYFVSLFFFVFLFVPIFLCWCSWKTNIKILYWKVFFIGPSCFWFHVFFCFSNPFLIFVFLFFFELCFVQHQWFFCQKQKTPTVGQEEVATFKKKLPVFCKMWKVIVFALFAKSWLMFCKHCKHKYSAKKQQK